MNGLRDLRDLAAERSNRAHFIKRIYVANTVPRNENGKPLRREAPGFVLGLPAINLE